MAIKRGLGKGLSALLPSNEAPKEKTKSPSPPLRAEAASGTAKGEKPIPGDLLIPLDKLKSNPNQPRKDFDDEELAELSDSIKQQGIIQPIIAEYDEDGTYTIIAGERRARAARLAGLSEVPVILRRYSDEKRMVVSLIENIQRANLNPVEEASAYRQLMELEDLSQDEVAVKVGKNRSTVANSLRLLKLPKEMLESIRKAELTPGHARAILSVSPARAQETLFREILKKGLSVREAEKQAATLGSKSKKTNKSSLKSRAPELDAMQDKFITCLGTKVKINGNLSRGNVVIDYYSMDDLDRIYEIIAKR